MYPRDFAFAVCLRAFGLVLPALAGVDAPAEELQIDLRTAGDAVFEVRGLPQAALEQLARLEAGDPAWSSVLGVYVGAQPAADQPAVLGRYELTQAVLRFRPRFDLQPGLTYRAVVDGSVLSQPSLKAARSFTLPKPDAGPPTVVAAVYPSAQRLPENLLRFYIHFSAPMQQGDAYRYLRLVDESGTAIERPFLELPQELWNRDGTRLTVLLDPGRVKQGLKPREEAGPVLVSGRNYTLVVDAAWPDADGRPLAQPFRKPFRATEADSVQPDPATWTLAPPPAGSRRPLVVRFPEPLDHAQLQRVLEVARTDGTPVGGTVAVLEGETVWTFTPHDPWTPGVYRLRAASTLEDRAGNSIGRPFEVDLTDPGPRPTAGEVRTLDFEVTAGE